MNPELIVKISLDIGAAMLKSGAETVRVEDTISRICRCYYHGRLEVTSYLSAVFISMEVPDYEKYPGCPHIITQHRRVSSLSNDLTKLEELNALSRYVCQNTPDIPEIEKRLMEISDRHISPYRLFSGYICASFAFTIFFGGTLLDGFCCILVSIWMYFLDSNLKKHLNNEFVHGFLLSLASGLPACLLQIICPAIHMDKIMIGTVMLLIPGIALTNSLRDLLTGDLVSGSLKLLNSLLLAVAVAMGFALSMIITGV